MRTEKKLAVGAGTSRRMAALPLQNVVVIGLILIGGEWLLTRDLVRAIGWAAVLLGARWVARRAWPRPGNGWWVILTAAVLAAILEAATGGTWKMTAVRWATSAALLTVAAPWFWNKIWRMEN